MIALSQYSQEQMLLGAKDRFLNNNLQVRLFKNDWTEDCLPVAGDFTEADFSGYARFESTLGWGTPVTAGPVSTLQAPAIATFTHDGGGVSNTIYGYTVHRKDSGEFLWAEKNPAGPVVLSAAGQVYVVVVVLQQATWDLVPCPW